MLYWFFVKGLGPIAIHRLGPTAQGLENIPHEGGAIIAANHLAVINAALFTADDNHRCTCFCQSGGDTLPNAGG